MVVGAGLSPVDLFCRIGRCDLFSFHQVMIRTFEFWFIYIYTCSSLFCPSLFLYIAPTVTRLYARTVTQINKKLITVLPAKARSVV